MFKVGDLVSRVPQENGTVFCIVDFKASEDGDCIAVLKGIYNRTYIIEAPVSELKNILPTGKL